MDAKHESRLNELRISISELDEDIISLLEARVSLAKEVGEIKKIYNKPIYVPELEKAKIEYLARKCNYPGLVEAIWPVIMCYTRTVE